MLRFGLLLSLAAAIAAVIAAWLVFGGSEPLPARFALADCRKVSLRDTQTGKLVRGAEDMLLLPDGDTLVVSAVDRSDQTLPFSGIFTVSLFDVEGGGDVIEASRLVESYHLPGGVHPYGIALDESGDRLALINRIGPETRTVIDVVELQEEGVVPVRRHEHEAYCRANDLAFDWQDNLLITRDRAACGASVLDVIPFYATGILLTLTPEGRLSAAEERYFFPNGIAMGPTGRTIIAEMRAERLAVGDDFEMPLPGGPDNLTVDDDGALIAAVHPSLWQAYLYANWFAFSSPSRVVRVEPGSRELDVLFDDPGGDLLSAVSVGLMAEDRLYMGSTVDEGIAVCEAG